MAGSLVSRALLSKAVLPSASHSVTSVRTGYVSIPNPWGFGGGREKSFKRIPGPRAVPVVGNLWKYYLGKYPLESMPSLYEDYLKEYGPLVKERFYYGRTLVHVFDPKDMNKIYFSERLRDPHRLSHRALAEYRQSRPEMYSNGGLACLNGKAWRNLRDSFGESFLNSRSNEAFELITDDLVAQINSHLPINSDVVMLPMLYRWALECVGVVALGQRLGCFAKDFDNRLDQFLECIHFSQRSVFYTENLPRIFTRGHYKQLVKCQDYIYMFLWPFVDAVGKVYDNKDNLVESDNPVALHKSTAYSLMERNLQDRDVKTLITDMFQGGIHSTAHILAFALYYLGQNPRIQADVRASLKEQFPNPDDRISSKPVDDKIKNVIRETMRLNPPTIGTGRVLQDDLVLSQYKVPKGTMCILHHQIASKQLTNFAHAEFFNPNRFDDSEMPEMSIVANSPFAMGERACPGRHIALNEIGIALSKILRLYEVSYKHEKVGTKNYLINEPDKEIKITFTPAAETLK